MFHQVLVVGHLGRDPEMRYTPAGVPVTNFSIATNRRYTKSDGSTVDQPIWFRVSTWRQLAETCNTYLGKGRMVLVVGTLNADENGNPPVFERNDGTPGAAYELTANTVRFLGGRNGNGSTDEVATDEAPAPAEVPVKLPW